MEKWKTAISTRQNGELYIRGYRFLGLLKKRDFIEIVFLLWRGKFPSRNETKMFNAMLVSAAEHGVEAPSTFVSRTVASCGTSFSAAIAAGVLAIGERHGGAVEKIAFHLQSGSSAKEIVSSALKRKEYLAGFGHKVYKTGDPRVSMLFSQAKKYKLAGKYIKKLLDIEIELKRQSGKLIPINIDGALGALLCELGFDWRLGKAVFILSRIAGISTHVLEEIKNEKSYRRLSEKDVEYIGIKPKK